MEHEQREQTPGTARKNRRWTWLWILLAAVLVLGIGTGMHFLNIPAIHVERHPGGIAVYMGDAAREAERQQLLQDPAQEGKQFVGDDTELAVEEARPGVQKPVSAQPGALSLQEIYAAAADSVVTVTAVKRYSSEQGSGILMSADGYLITSYRMIENAVELQVQLADERTLSAALVGSDSASDLAVVKVDGTDLPAAQFGDSDMLRVGDAVAVITCPAAGFGAGLTDGIISGIGTQVQAGGRSLSLLQTNAVQPGSASGAPLLNCYGQVVGVCTVSLWDPFTTSGVGDMGMAIPVNTVKAIVDEIIARGYVAGKPSIGIRAEDLPVHVRMYYSLPAGAYVTQVDPSSDAYARGLRPGHVITGFNGETVADCADLMALKDRCAAGRTVKLTVYAGGQPVTMEVELMANVSDT